MTSRFYQYCKSNIKQKKIQEVSIKTAFTFLAEGKHIVSFVGAGGKSSLIDAIAKWSSSQGKKVLVTTTTHIFRPQDEFLAMNEKQLQEIWAAGHWAVIGATEEKDPQKLKMPELDWSFLTLYSLRLMAQSVCHVKCQLIMSLYFCQSRI